jgi:hypothetical protein
VQNIGLLDQSCPNDWNLKWLLGTFDFRMFLFKDRYKLFKKIHAPNQPVPQI